MVPMNAPACMACPPEKCAPRVIIVLAATPLTPMAIPKPKLVTIVAIEGIAIALPWPPLVSLGGPAGKTVGAATAFQAGSMGVVIAQEPLSRRYEARWWSLAACFHFACYVALVIVPFIIAYSSQCARAPSARASRHRAGRSHPSREPNLPSRPRRAGAALWLKEKTGREQPEAHFQHEVLVLAQGVDPSQQYAFSTSPSVNALFGDAMRAMSVRLSETDADHDGRPEQLHVEVSLPLRAGEEVVGVTVLVALSYALQDTARFSANATAIAQHTGAGAGSGVELFGDLELRAARALPPVSAGSSGPAKLMGVSSASTLDGLSPAALIARCAAAGAAGAAWRVGHAAR